MEFSHKGALCNLPAGYAPWFSYPSQVGKTIFFGHWAALNGHTGRTFAAGLDTGCVWGRDMTAVRLDDRRSFSIPASRRDAALQKRRGRQR